jgi:hypothetical protein
MTWAGRVRRVYTLGGIAVAAGVVALWIPGATVAAESWMIGTLVGIVNVQMLSRGLTRGLSLTPGNGAKATLIVTGGIRLALVLGVLAWAGIRLKHVAVVPLLAGVFLPQGAMVAGLMRDLGKTRGKGDSP